METKKPLVINLMIMILVLVLLITSCAIETPGVKGNITNISAQITPESSGPCPGKYICISSSVQAYQDKNCHIVNRTTCETECIDGNCREKEIRFCAPGFKCRNSYERAFQRESCAWEKTEKCEFGCNFNTSKCYNQSQAAQAAVVEQNIIKTMNYPTIKLGEIVDINSENLTIYLLEPDRVQFKLD